MESKLWKSCALARRAGRGLMATAVCALASGCLLDDVVMSGQDGRLALSETISSSSLAGRLALRPAQSAPNTAFAYGSRVALGRPIYQYAHAHEGQTPVSTPTARIINTGALKRLMQQHADLVLIDVNSGPGDYSIPGAYGVAGLEWSLSDPGRRKRVDAVLQRLSHGNLNQPLVFFCAGVRCQLSYDAARYATQAGYLDVIWYSGGLDAWVRSGGNLEEARYVEW